MKMLLKKQEEALGKDCNGGETTSGFMINNYNFPQNSDWINAGLSYITVFAIAVPHTSIRY